MNSESTNIDVVFTWVDGNDPRHIAKMRPYLQNSEHLHDDIAGPTRFRPSGELLFSVASIFRYAPFVRNIYVVTDNQEPQIQETIKQHFPESTTKIIIVDHKTIFEGFEEFLPVFSSRAIETMLYRIPDLSEQFVYFNDDFFLLRPIQPVDWFQNNIAMAYGYRRSILVDKLISFVKPRKKGHKPIGYKDGLLRAAETVKEKSSYFYMQHAPFPILRSTLEDYFTNNQDILKVNISDKFRSKDQFNPQELFYLLGFRRKKCILAKNKKVLFMKPVNRGDKYVPEKISIANANPDIAFGCVESMDMATDQDKKRITEWFEKLTGVKLI